MQQNRRGEQVRRFFAGVTEYAFQTRLGVADPPGVIQRRRPADEVAQEPRQLGLKLVVGCHLGVFVGKLVECPDQCFRNVTAAKLAKTTGGVRHARICAHLGSRGAHIRVFLCLSIVGCR